ncbi:MAG: replication-associated recombination protein A, partial [Proteobacteria bacterium]|nr:replication-associated recombination protein A [Pseudomonadota bacterium]
MELFDTEEMEGRKESPATGPLADRMRPRTLTEVIGQAHLLGAEKIIERSIESGTLPSLILWGPPGSGKTTLGRIIAKSTRADFVTFSAVLSGVKEVREVIKRAKEAKRMDKKTILFVDEIHRFNKAQQDAFLHHVEDGLITLIGATTENPSFEINAALLSRCKVLVLNKLEPDDIKNILIAALGNSERGLASMNAKLAGSVMDIIAESADGDARWALNTLESAVMMTEPDDDGVRSVTKETCEEAMQKKALIYDKGAEEHYNIISAFIKSMRGSDPDAAIYWLARMVEAGEDALFICRRMVIFASEDIGNADPRALSVALGVKDSVHFVGMPEGFIPLSQGAAYLATAPKSNSSYKAYKEARKDVQEKGALPVPMHIRNAPTKLMKGLGYGEGYQYPHDTKDGYVT